MDESQLKAMKADLDANGLTMPTGHLGLDLLESEPEQALLIAKTLGLEAIYCPYLMPDQRPTAAAGWLAFGKRLAEAGQRYPDAGHTFGWHHHASDIKARPDGAPPPAQTLYPHP